MSNLLPRGPWDNLRKDIEEVLRLPPGSTSPIHIFKPGGYKSSQENELEMSRRLYPYVEDERKASEDYFNESENADLIGRPDIAYTLRKMSEDEHHHYVSLQGILRDLMSRR